MINEARAIVRAPVHLAAFAGVKRRAREGEALRNAVAFLAASRATNRRKTTGKSVVPRLSEPACLEICIPPHPSTYIINHSLPLLSTTHSSPSIPPRERNARADQMEIISSTIIPPPPLKIPFHPIDSSRPRNFAEGGGAGWRIKREREREREARHGRSVILWRSLLSNL